MGNGALLLLCAAVAVGAAVPVQSAINAQMASAQGHPLYGALTNTAVASLALASLVFALRLPAPNLRAASSLPWWTWSGGFIGAAFVFGALFVAPKIGAAAFAAATIFGTVAASLLIDHYGLFEFPVRTVTLTRLAGISLVFLGVGLLQGARA